MSAVAAVPRNRPCPCGSGRKHKLCCGTTRAEERDVARCARAAADLAAAPKLFPLLRPECQKFDRWAARAVSARPLEDGETVRLVVSGVDALARGERARIVGWLGERFPSAWASFAAELGEEVAVEALLAGAVVAGLEERRPPDPGQLEVLDAEGDLRDDAAETLAWMLEPSDLWSVGEAAVAQAALDAVPEEELDDDRFDAVVATCAETLATRAHRRRLVRLVEYVRAHLPVAGYPAASRALAAACEAFERRREVRARLAALLLADAL